MPTSWVEAARRHYPARTAPAATPPMLRLIGEFGLVVRGQPVAVGASCQRLLALIAINEGRIGRRRAAGLLWPDAAVSRANANLRSALWRLQQGAVRLLRPSNADVHLAPGVEVDLQAVVNVAHRLMDRSRPMGSANLNAALRSNLHQDLLPDLDEEWLVTERMRHRQLRLHSLEILSERLSEAGWFGAAVDAGLAAVRADPLRESAHEVLIRAYLAEGNQSEAHRQFRLFEQALRSELGLTPSDQLRRLVEGSRAAPARAARAPDR